MSENALETGIESALPQRIRALPRATALVPTHRLAAPGCDVLFIAAPAGSGVPAHHHDTDNATVVVSGETILTTADGEHRYGAGDWYETESGEEHAVRFEVDTVQVELRFAQEGAGA
ncbi:MAG TPA: cupin domain-containing protein [Jatrophihabitans sp.]|nr:cupin domain-containing protein [Jatrophihabitans sp.]